MSYPASSGWVVNEWRNASTSCYTSLISVDFPSPRRRSLLTRLRFCCDVVFSLYIPSAQMCDLLTACRSQLQGFRFTAQYAAAEQATQQGSPPLGGSPCACAGSMAIGLQALLVQQKLLLAQRARMVLQLEDTPRLSRLFLVRRLLGASILKHRLGGCAAIDQRPCVGGIGRPHAPHGDFPHDLPALDCRSEGVSRALTHQAQLICRF
jgi:hypothetical protein